MMKMNNSIKLNSWRTFAMWHFLMINKLIKNTYRSLVLFLLTDIFLNSNKITVVVRV